MKERSGLTPRGLEDAALLLSWRYWALGSLVGQHVYKFKLMVEWHAPMLFPLGRAVW
jgi:hypothetical protein